MSTTPFLWIIILYLVEEISKKITLTFGLEKVICRDIRKCLGMIVQRDNFVLYLDVQTPTGGSGLTHGPLLSGVTAGIQQFTPLSF